MPETMAKCPKLSLLPKSGRTQKGESLTAMPEPAGWSAVNHNRSQPERSPAGAGELERSRRDRAVEDRASLRVVSAGRVVPGAPAVPVFAIDVRTAVPKERAQLVVPGSGRAVQRRGPVDAVNRVDIRAAIQEQDAHIQVPAMHCPVKRGDTLQVVRGGLCADLQE